MRRKFNLSMYDDLTVDVYFASTSDIENIPIVCYTRNEQDIDVEEVVFLVDESIAMNTYTSGIKKWYWAKELVIKQIIRYLKDYVKYSYITSDSSLDTKLFDKYIKDDALAWIDYRQISDGWNAMVGLENAHKPNIFNPNAALIIVTSGSDCPRSNWMPDVVNGTFYKHYFVFNFDEGGQCGWQYHSIWESFLIGNMILNQYSSFDYKYTITKHETLSNISNLFTVIADREYHQQTAGIPNESYMIFSHKLEEPFFLTTDETGYFTVEDLDQLPPNSDFIITYNESFRFVEKCLSYQEPIMPHDSILCFIDEADNTYTNEDSSTATQDWENDVSLYDDMSNYVNMNQFLCFDVERGSSTRNDSIPYTAIDNGNASPSPIQIIRSPRNDPNILLDGQALTGDWIKSHVDTICPNPIGKPRLFILIDASGSMERSSIATGLDEFIADYGHLYNIIELQQGNERWLKWIFDESQNIHLPEKPDPIPEIITELPATSDQYVHFSEMMLGGRNIYGQLTKINQPSSWCHVLGSGEVANAEDVLPNLSTLDGIAISNNARMVVYSEPNFEGEILFDLNGPVVLNNNVYNDELYYQLHYEDYEQELQTLYPQQRRLWVHALREFKYGSFKIIFEPNTTTTTTTALP